MGGGVRAVSVVIVVVALLGCRSTDRSDGADEPAGTALRVRVASAEVAADEVIGLTIDGAPARGSVEIEVTSIDRAGVAWSSTTTVRADADGRVPLGDEPMAPFSVLTPVDGAAGLQYAWTADGNDFTVTARADGRAPGRVEIRRRVAVEGVTTSPTTLADDGVLGALWSPPEGAGVGSAVLLIGGSEGGLARQVDAAALASRGVVALEMAHFEAPGLPDQLVDVPLETFDAALARLRDQPGVDPERVWLAGASRGSEAAVLVAARHPELVAGVVVTAPGSVVGCSPVDCTRPAWTDGDVPLPFARLGEAPGPEVILPVEAVDGPVIATCGEDDELWPACPQAGLLFDRLGAADRPPGDHLVSDPSAGHSVGSMTPYAWPASTTRTDGLELGGDPRADDRVRAEAWPLILEALGAEAP